MLTMCVCDDDPKDLAQIRALAESFAGAYPEFSMEIQAFSSAFDVAACGYLVKPIDRERFDRALLADVQRLTRSENRCFLLKTRESLRRIPFGIWW